MSQHPLSERPHLLNQHLAAAYLSAMQPTIQCWAAVPSLGSMLVDTRVGMRSVVRRQQSRHRGVTGWMHCMGRSTHLHQHTPADICYFGLVSMHSVQPLLAVRIVDNSGFAGVGGSTALWAHWRSRAGRTSRGASRSFAAIVSASQCHSNASHWRQHSGCCGNVL